MLDCPVIGCRARIAPEHLALCRQHERELPWPIRDELNRTFRNGRGYGTPAYEAALAAAIAAANERPSRATDAGERRAS